jgi:outer membrane protein
MTARHRLAPLALVLLLVAPGAARADRSVTLDEAYALALRNNPSMAMLRERVVQAEAAHYKAWSALKPNATFQGTFTHYDQQILLDFTQMFSALGIPVPAGTEPTVLQKQNQFGLVGVANLPLFRGPAYPRLDMAKKGVEVAKLRELRSRQDFLLRVAQAYYGVVSRKEVVTALENKLEVDRKNLAAARSRHEVGQSPRSEVLRADLVVTQDEQNLLTQRNALDAARRQLAILLVVPGAVDATRPAEPEDPTLSDEEMVASALGRRADLKAADLALVIAKQSRKAAWWSFLPSLDAAFLWRWSEAAGFAGEKSSWNLTFTLTVPIYDGGLRYADLRDSASRIVEARAQKAALDLEVRAEIVRLRADLQSATAGLTAARKAVALARTTAGDLEASFEVGAATQLDVLDGNQRLLDAELQLTTTLYTRDLARLALAHAQGRFDPSRGVR